MLAPHFMWKCGAAIQLPAGFPIKNQDGRVQGHSWWEGSGWGGACLHRKLTRFKDFARLGAFVPAST